MSTNYEQQLAQWRQGQGHQQAGGYPQGNGYPPATMPAKPRKKKRVFLWVFLAVQAIFIIWLIAGAATDKTAPSQSAAGRAQLASACYQGHWSPLFKSQQDCVTHYGHALTQAGDLGKGIGMALVFGLWVGTDVVLGVGYGIYRLARR